MYVCYVYVCMFVLSVFCTIELPLPGVEFIVSSSTTGSGEDSCLNVVFTDTTNSITCVADVVSNLLVPPNILIMNGDSSIITNNFSLMQEISDSDAAEFTCTVCVEVPEADIVNHCNRTTLLIVSDGQYTFNTCSSSFINYMLLLYTVPRQVVPSNSSGQY